MNLSYLCDEPFQPQKSVFNLLVPIHGESGGSFSYFFVYNNLINILQKIFSDHYEQMKYTLHPRKTEMENIDKMINYSDPSFSGIMYSYPSLPQAQVCPFSLQNALPVAINML